MTIDRQAISGALLDIVSLSGNFKTVGRRVQLWTKTPLQPALFIRFTGEDWAAAPTGMPRKVTLVAEAWVYVTSVGDAAVPGDDLDDLVSAVTDSLAPPVTAPDFLWADARQSLGGIVQHCWIEGRMDKWPGDQNGQSIARIPIRILVP